VHGSRAAGHVVDVAVGCGQRARDALREEHSVAQALAEQAPAGGVGDHVTLYRWVQRFIPLLVDAAGPCRHAAGCRWFVDETYVKVAGHWRYVYRAVDQYGQVIDVLVSARRNLAAERFFGRVLAVTEAPQEVVTDKAHALVRVVADLLPSAFRHESVREQSGRGDHGRLKARLRPMRGLKTDRTASTVFRAHAFIQTCDEATTPSTATPGSRVFGLPSRSMNLPP
jgi:IS6 family transposase